MFDDIGDTMYVILVAPALSSGAEALLSLLSALIAADASSENDEEEVEVGVSLES